MPTGYSARDEKGGCGLNRNLSLLGALIACLALSMSGPLRAEDATQNQTPADARPADQPPSVSDVNTIPVVELSKPKPEDLTATPAEPESPHKLEEVVVTAQKTKQSLRKVPISVTALGGEFIKQTGSASLADASLYIPNVRVEAHDYGSPQVFIRGFGTNAFNPSFESSVAFVQDEIYFGRPGYFTEAMFDIDRVEVLRGPQGTLFGKNTVAGVFNVLSKGPTPEYTADVSYYYGEHNEQRVEGGAGGMVTDWLGVRVSGLYIGRSGQLYNEFLNRYEDRMRQQAGRVKIKLYAGYGIESELTAVDSQTHAPFWPLQLMKLDADTRTYLRNFDAHVEDNPLDFKTEMNEPGWISKGSDTVGLRTHWAIGDLGPLHDFDPVLVIGWSKFHIDQLNEIDVSPADISNLDSHEDHQQRSAELRFTGNFDSLFGLGKKVEFVAGAFYFKSDYTLFSRVLAGRDLPSYATTCDFRLLAGIPDAGCTLPVSGLLAQLGNITGLLTGPVLTDNDFYRFDYTQEIDSRALFGQFTWNITDRIAITPGVRVNKEKKFVTSRGAGHCPAKDATGSNLCLMETLVMGQDYNQPHLRREESDVSPKLALQYFAEHDVNYYASYARGYKSGGFNAISFDGRDAKKLEYEPEKARTYELGAKGKFFHKTLGVNIGVYDTHFDNLQVLAFNGFFFTVSNAGTAYSRGLETDFNWITPYAPLRIMGSGALLNAHYIHYLDAPAPISQGVNVRLPDAAGKRIAFAPSSTATLTPTLTYLFFGNFLVTLAGDVLWQGDQFTDVDDDPNVHVGGYTKYAARLIFANTRGNWSLAIGGTNLTDKRVLNQVVDATFFPGSYFAQQASGRQLFAMVSLKL